MLKDHVRRAKLDLLRCRILNPLIVTRSRITFPVPEPNFMSADTNDPDAQPSRANVVKRPIGTSDVVVEDGELAASDMPRSV